jgi:hypothetical protein
LRHRHDELTLQDFVNPLHAGGTVRCESPTVAAADACRVRAQREGFQYVEPERMPLSNNTGTPLHGVDNFGRTSRVEGP